MLAGHDLGDGIRREGILANRAEQSGIGVGGDGDLLQGVNGGFGGGGGSGVSDGGGGGEMVNEAVEVRSIEEEIVVGSVIVKVMDRERVTRGRGRIGMVDVEVEVDVHVHLLEGIAMAVRAEEGVGGRGRRQADAHVTGVAPVSGMVEETGKGGGRRRRRRRRHREAELELELKLSLGIWGNGELGI